VSRLFIELYLDEDVDVLLAELLRDRGFVAITTREAGQLGVDDTAQLAYAVSQQKTFFTHNRADFEALAQTYFRAGQSHYGIIIATRHDRYQLARRALVILNQVTADELENQLRYI
jgi:hypothetical protein